MDLVTRDLPNDNYLWWIYGAGDTQWFWSRFQAGGGFRESQWLTISHRPVAAPAEAAIVDLSGNDTFVDPREADAVTFDIEGRHTILPRDVEYFESSLATTTDVRWLEHFGATTDGSLDVLFADVGNHDFDFTAAVKDSSLHLGAGWDRVDLIDHRDIPGEQYWSLIRRGDNSIDAYSLLTGRRISMEDGVESRNGTPGNKNFGEVEQIFLTHAQSGSPREYIPGTDLPDEGDRGTFENIDLRSDGTPYSNSFNLAYFNFIRYTSDNVWVGEATIHDGTASTVDTALNYSTPSDRRVTTDKNNLLKSGYGYDAPVLDGQLSVIGQSRNGTHDLIVAERNLGEAINGHFRLYAFDVDSDLYNEFNQVYLGTSAGEQPTNFASATADTPANRVAMYGFGGNDILASGAGKDYLFGGRSTFNLINSALTQIDTNSGNVITGGTGADYVGTGATNSLGQLIDGAGSVLGTGLETGAPQGSFIGSTSTGGTDGKGVGLFWVSHATDVLTDWEAGIDTLVVLENGVTIIGGVRNGTSVTDLRGSNTSSGDGNTTIDLRATAAVATSDQDFDGARGGDDWDQTQTLDYIHTNQAARDTESITKEASDVTVVNAGLVVARGLDGADTIFDSPGDDYLYGNRGSNTISLSSGGNDRVYYDTFDGAQARHYVSGFTKSSGAATDQDTFYLNKGVIDAFNASGSTRTLSTADVNGVYNDAIAYRPSINFLHDTFYNPSIVTTNAVHRGEDGSAPSVLSGSDGTTFGIGVGMFAAGTALLFVPFMSGVGYALMASGTALGAGSALVNTQPHQNATFGGNVGAYLNVLTESPDSNGDGTLIKPSTSVGSTDSSVSFLSFFSGVDAGDGYLPVVEFTSHANQGIYGYFALHSTTETFVYLVASRDNLVTNSEAIQIAQIEGHLTAADFGIYDGRVDIYNQANEDPITIVEPTIVTLGDNTISNVLELSPKRFDDVDNPLELTVTVPGDVVGANIKIFDGTSTVFDGTSGTYTSSATGNNPGGDVTMTSSTYDSGTGLTTFVFSDQRVLGTKAIQTDTNALDDATNGNQFQLADTTVNYTIAFADPTSGIETYDGTGGVEVAGGNATIDGQAGDDILFVSETSDFLNSALNGQIVSIESIAVTGSANINLSNQSEGFSVSGSGAADTIVGGAGANYIVGGGGNDSLTGAANNDTFVGFEGNDTIDASGGSQDRLVLSGTSSTLNSASNGQLIGVDIVEIKVAETDPIFGLTIVSGEVTEVEVVNPGSGLTDGTYTVTLAPSTAYTTAATVTITVSNGSVEIPPALDENNNPIPNKPGYYTPLTSGSGYVDTQANPVGDATVTTIPTSSTGISLDLSGQSEGFTIIGDTYADSIVGGQGNDIISSGGGSDDIDLSAGGSDRIDYSHSVANLGLDAEYDVITSVASDDDLYVSSFSDRDGQSSRLAYEIGSGGNNKVASGTELLVVTGSRMGSSGDLTQDIATALGATFDLSGLDGRTPSDTTGATGATDASVLFAVQSNTVGYHWVGQYEDTGNDDVISGSDIEVFAHVQSSNILQNFWLPTELAPQELTLNLPATIDTGAGELYTQSTTFSVDGLQSGNRVYYSLDGGSTWQTSAVDQTVIALNTNQSNDIRVRQVDGINYSPETTAGANSVTPVTVIWDDDSPTTAIGSFSFTSLGLYSKSTFNGKPLYSNVQFDSGNDGTADEAKIYFDFDNKSDIDSGVWGPGSSGTFNGKYLIVNSIKVHDLDNQLSDYANGLQTLGDAWWFTDELGRLTINTDDFSADDTSGADTRLYVDIDIPLIGGGTQNFVFDGYIDWGPNII